MKETRTVGVSKTVGAGAETKKAVERVAVQEEVIEYEVSDDPRTEESAVLEAEADAPEEAVNKVIVGDDLAVVNRHLGCQLRSRRRDVGDGGYGVAGTKYLIFCLGLSV
ncbi:hypothetical protein PR001_g20761 [Phytophthora rubi]|uniref:Uncharacterized protein n=1 Tax=Phytophthora rubi TaxID=129364 RepID=A0A6A3JD77_9STRA|nr:hypothetical protein PR001_g20761 [Phytophthora rubi]